jgi:hypothetical protein
MCHFLPEVFPADIADKYILRYCCQSSFFIMKASRKFRDGIMMTMKACRNFREGVMVITTACQKSWEAIIIIMKISRKLKLPGMNKSHNSLIISYLSHKGKKSSPDLQHHTGMMPEACQDFWEGSGIMPKACQDSCEGTGIMPEASKELKEPGGKKNRNLLKINWLIVKKLSY